MSDFCDHYYDLMRDMAISDLAALVPLREDAACGFLS